jgi:predicted amidohydrolase
MREAAGVAGDPRELAASPGVAFATEGDILGDGRAGSMDSATRPASRIARMGVTPMPAGWTVAMAQVRPVLGGVAENLHKHLDWVRRAREAGAQLVVFPELGLTGYQVRDLTLDVARSVDAPEIRALVDASRDIDVVFSFVEESVDHRFYITALYAHGGSVVHRHRKVYLPTYGMFDEGRDFAEGNRFETFPTDWGPVGIMICEDAWHVSSPYLLAMGGARVILVPAASPARSVTDQRQFGSQTFWQQLLQVYARLFGAYLVFVNRTGFEDGISFFGGSCAVGPDGQILAEAPVLEEALVLASLDLGAVRRARYTTPILRDERLDVVRDGLDRLLNREL